MIATGVRVEAVARFAGDGRVWRSFDHLVAYSGSALLLVPVGLARGNLMGVVDGLPVPWEEVVAVLSAEGAEARGLTVEALVGLNPLLAVVFTPEGWVVDRVPPGPKVPTLTRAIGPDGVRWAKARAHRFRA